MADFYTFKPLRLQERAFRLLRLKKGTGRSIECSLIHTTLDDEKGQYEAISYTWGRKGHADVIEIDGEYLSITLNLSLILRDLRDPHEDRTLWVDAICINQDDVDERGVQVQQMSSIFRNARRVLFCISQPNAMTDLWMDSLKELENRASVQEPTNGIDQLRAIWRDMETELSSRHFALYHRHEAGLEYILSQPWFSRVWIIQEVANAREALVYCGRKSVSAGIFAASPQLIPVWGVQSTCYQPILDLMPGPARHSLGSNDSRKLFSLLRTFSYAQATEELDRVYALLGICADSTHETALKPDYNRSVPELIRDTISHICDYDQLGSSELPYTEMDEFLGDLQSLDNMELLFWAATEGHSPIIKWLLDQGVNTEAQFLKGRTALMSAAAQGHTEIVEMLLDRGANLEAVDYYNHTAVLKATAEGQTDTARLLMKRGANFKIKDRDGWVAVTCAAQGDHVRTMELLLDNGIDLEARNSSGYTTLQRALFNEWSLSIIKVLFDGGANVEARDDRGRTVLMTSSALRLKELTQMLLDYGADIHAKDNSGSTVFTYASGGGSKRIVKMMTDRGATFQRLGSPTDLLEQTNRTLDQVDDI